MIPNKFPMNITASDYLEAQRRAARSATDKIAFRRIQEQLKNLKEVRERLAFEFLAMACEDLERGGDGRPAIEGTLFGGSIREENLTKYSAWLERLASQCFGLMHRSHTIGLELTLTATLASLRRINGERFHQLSRILLGSCAKGETSRRCEIMAQANWSPAERRENLRKSRKGTMILQRKNENAAKSNLN
jgi:hypothetical protein